MYGIRFDRDCSFLTLMMCVTCTSVVNMCSCLVHELCTAADHVEQVGNTHAALLSCIDAGDGFDKAHSLHLSIKKT